MTTRYEIYFTRSLEGLQDELFLGAAASPQEACALIHQALKDNGYKEEPYWRWLFNAEGAFIDFGSWSMYLAIIGATKEDFFN